MSASHAGNPKLQLAAVSGAIALALLAGSSQAQITQSVERKNMQRSGHTDLQGRSSYQPTAVQHPNGRWYLFAGLHSTIPVPNASCPTGTLPNPLNGGACEANGTMIIDVTDPNNPFEVFHIPATPGGQSTMVRACRGDQLPGGNPQGLYIIRSVQGGTNSGYEQWDVTNPAAPVRLTGKALTGVRSTHKLWWECTTGIAYMPGSLDAAHSPLGQAGVWRQSQSMVIYDWSNPLNGQPPVYIRTFGLPGAQPTGTSTVPPALHGPISAHEHPNAGQQLAGGADVIGNRIYAAWGVGDDGIMTIIDRKKLLPAQYGGTWVPTAGVNGVGTTADNPSEADLYGPTSPTVGYYLMSPDQGGHSSWPIFGLQPKGFAKFSDLKTRDIVVMTSEATANTANGSCQDAPHVGSVVDVTIENSMTVPPGRAIEHAPENIYQGPMALGTLWVDPRFGERYPRGNYCNRPVRFGTHSTDENFNSPLVGKLTTVAWFNGGLRVWDIREPFNVMQVAFYVTEGNANTPTVQNQLAYMTNNVDVDNRGNIYIVDRNGAGMDILQLTGCAAQIVTANGTCPRIDNP